MKKTILLCDDDESVLMVCGDRLKQVGYDILAFSSGDEVIKSLRNLKIEQIDLIVMDIKMKGKTGIEVLKEIRQFNPKVPIIVYTAYPEMKNLQDVFFLNIGAFVEKGSVNELIKKINELLFK